MFNPDRQYYGPGGDFIPFSNVDYSNIDDDRAAYTLYFMEEVVYMMEAPLPTERYVTETGIKLGKIKGKIDRYMPGVGQIELFMIEAFDGYTSLFHARCFTKYEFSQQCKLRKNSTKCTSLKSITKYVL